ncbi:Prenylated Rab acceptor protein 1 [Choanephora cucurbitarum]|uniref:PRA1 family protein n=1 Tax=Choanephora cucurbitarum TaxID=101091 RepID=A0A1C7NLA3_9FUNG|nr:Prenylated Rab acceptor protein 1 [Choanephora cucurbitarum]
MATAATLLVSSVDSFINKSATTIIPDQLPPSPPTTTQGDAQVEGNRYLNYLKKFKQERLSDIRPLSDFFDRNRFKLTSSFELVSQRWSYNLQYFSSNYLLIMLCLAMYAVLTNWFLLFTMAFIYGGFHMILKLSQSGSLTIGGRVMSMPTVYTTYALGSFLLLLVSGATHTLFWIIGAGALIILCHAAVLEPGLEGDFADVQV